MLPAVPQTEVRGTTRADPDPPIVDLMKENNEHALDLMSAMTARSED